MSRKSIFNKAGVFILVNVVILFFLVIAFGREYVGNIQVEREIRALEEQRQQLEQDKLSTLNLIEELSSEEYLEEEARTKFGLAEPGETLIVIQDGDSIIQDVDELLREDEPVIIPNQKKWFYLFFDRNAYEELQDTGTL